MSDDRPKRDTMSLEEATVSNMWEIAAIVEVLERKGLCTKSDLYDIIAEFRRKNPRASIPETAFPEPYLLTETENTIIDDMLELLNKHGLTSHQSQHLLERMGGFLRWGSGRRRGRRIDTHPFRKGKPYRLIDLQRQIRLYSHATLLASVGGTCHS